MLQSIEKSIKRASLLKKSIRQKTHSGLHYYKIVYVLTHENEFYSSELKDNPISATAIFTEEKLASDFSRGIQNKKYEVKPAMLGRVIESQKHEETIKVVSINPDMDGIADDIIFVPLFDTLTKQNLLSPSDDAISLLSIDKVAHYNMGAETVFFSLNNKLLPETGEGRVEKLESLVEDLAFIIPRISLKKGSFNIICLILNLENYVEEKAFIREYKTFDSYTDTIFVTSELKILNGRLEEIKYDGSNLEGIYIPLYEMQNN